MDIQQVQDQISQYQEKIDKLITNIPYSKFQAIYNTPNAPKQLLNSMLSIHFLFDDIINFKDQNNLKDISYSTDLQKIFKRMKDYINSLKGTNINRYSLIKAKAKILENNIYDQQKMIKKDPRLQNEDIKNIIQLSDFLVTYIDLRENLASSNQDDKEKSLLKTWQTITQQETSYAKLTKQSRDAKNQIQKNNNLPNTRIKTLPESNHNTQFRIQILPDLDNNDVKDSQDKVSNNQICNKKLLSLELLKIQSQLSDRSHADSMKSYKSIKESQILTGNKKLKQFQNKNFQQKPEVSYFQKIALNAKLQVEQQVQVWNCQPEKSIIKEIKLLSHKTRSNNYLSQVPIHNHEYILQTQKNQTSSNKNSKLSPNHINDKFFRKYHFNFQIQKSKETFEDYKQKNKHLSSDDYEKIKQLTCKKTPKITINNEEGFLQIQTQKPQNNFKREEISLTNKINEFNPTINGQLEKNIHNFDVSDTRLNNQNVDHSDINTIQVQEIEKNYLHTQEEIDLNRNNIPHPGNDVASQDLNQESHTNLITIQNDQFNVNKLSLQIEEQDSSKLDFTKEEQQDLNASQTIDQEIIGQIVDQSQTLIQKEEEVIHQKNEPVNYSLNITSNELDQKFQEDNTQKNNLSTSVSYESQLVYIYFYYIYFRSLIVFKMKLRNQVDFSTTQ